MKRKRDTPRRDEGRVVHERMKPRAKAAPTAAEQRHMDRVAGMGCLVCRRPAEVHHIMHAPDKVRRRDHRYIAPLCPEHHRTGWGAVHALGSEAAFEATHNLPPGYLIQWAAEAWKASEEMEA